MAYAILNKAVLRNLLSVMSNMADNQFLELKKHSYVYMYTQIVKYAQ